MGGGKLKVKVVNGRGLQNKETLSTSDPYYMVELGEQMQKTKYVSSNLNPDWNEEFVLNVKPGQDVVSLSIWDKNTIKTILWGILLLAFRTVRNVKVHTR